MRAYILAIFCVLVSALAQAAELKNLVKGEVEKNYRELEELYKELHRNPELSHQEVKTSKRVADELRKLGFEVTTNVGGVKSVVGVLRNGTGPTLLVRTDLDALPIVEATSAPYKSTLKTTDTAGNKVGVMHACGHDMHISVFIGTARVLTELKNHWRGTLVMIAQPAEEVVQGARAMIADGLFTRFPKPDTCLALHCAADLPAGSVGVTEGYALANVDTVDITVRGISGHGAWPHKTKDPIVLAAQMVMAFQTIVSRETNPTEAAVVTVGSIHGGSKHNIIPEEVKLELTLRSYSPEVRQHTLEAVKRISKGLAAAAGLPESRHPIVSLQDQSVASTYNDPELSRKLYNHFANWFGESRVVKTKPTMGAEDFGLYGKTPEKIPICIYWLGTVEASTYKQHQQKGTPLPPLHSDKFLPDLEPTLKTGVEAMSSAVLEILKKN